MKRINRRQAWNTVVGAGACGWVVRGQSARQDQELQLWVNPAEGDDRQQGTRQQPLRTLAEAVRRVNASDGTGPVTIFLSEGVHAIGESIVLKPERRVFTERARLTIRAEVLPGDPEWHTGRMPALIHTLPVPSTWNGRPDPLGGAANGMLVETSHVTIRGLKILGLPVVETPRPGLIRRLYAISRLRRDLEDLEIAQCLFAGEEVTNPIHVGIIANGNRVRVHHCIFRGMKISVVYWTPGSTGHAMTHCFCHAVYGSSIWTSQVANDFDYRNNVVHECNYVWTAQEASSTLADAEGRRAGPPAPGAGKLEPMRYKVLSSHFARNRRLTGTGTGARLEYRDIDSSVLELINTKVTGEPVAIEMDSTKPNYLHPVAGSAAAATGAGLFLNV
ncbi:MAG: hypothetical protein WHT08_12790 [Bryobacteraceae bacterium]